MTAMVDDETLDFSTSDDVQIVESFDAMGLKDELLRGIYAYGSRPGAGGRRRRCGADGRPAPRAGFEKPSAIQQRAIMPILKGRDTIAQAQSGTGKTTIFSARRPRAACDHGGRAA